MVLGVAGAVRHEDDGKRIGSVGGVEEEVVESTAAATTGKGSTPPSGPSKGHNHHLPPSGPSTGSLPPPLPPMAPRWSIRAPVPPFALSRVTAPSPP